MLKDLTTPEVGFFKKYTIGEHVGSGFSASVYKAVRKKPHEDGGPLVVKVVNTEDDHLLQIARHERDLIL